MRRVVAILFQLAVTTLLLMTRSFEAVLEFIQFSLTFCSFLAVLGVIVLRVRQPDLVRPYRMWGYPVTPLVFLAVTVFMMYYLLRRAAGRIAGQHRGDACRARGLRDPRRGRTAWGSSNDG